jgi:DNA-binding XRE family transcriptional regulator
MDVGLFDRLLSNKGAHTDAKRAELLDCDRITVWRWRNRKLKPSLDQAVRIASFLQVSVEELFPKQVTDG